MNRFAMRSKMIDLLRRMANREPIGGIADEIAILADDFSLRTSVRNELVSLLVHLAVGTPDDMRTAADMMCEFAYIDGKPKNK